MNEYSTRPGVRTEIVDFARATTVTAVVVTLLNLSLVTVAGFFVELPTEIAAFQLTQVAVASIVPTVVAAIVYFLLYRYTSAPKLNLLVVNTVVLTVSFLGFANFEPGASGTPGAIPADPQVILNTLIVLSVLHVVTAAVVVAGLVGLTDRGSIA